MEYNIPECFYRVAVKALILDQEKRFLLVKEKCGQWELPGGGLDYGENPRDGLAREIREEMGLEILSMADCPAYFFTARKSTGHWLANILYPVVLKDLNFQPSEECVEIGFFTSEAALKLDIYDNVRRFSLIYRPA